MSEYIIQKHNRNDAALLLAAFSKSLQEDFTYYPKNVMKSFSKMWSEKYFRRSKPIFIVAKIENEIVGFVIGRKQWFGSGVSQIEWVWVNSQWRKQGIAKAMLEKTATILKAKGYHKIVLTAYNPESWDTYKHLGFTCEGKAANDFWHLDHYAYGREIK